MLRIAFCLAALLLVSGCRIVPEGETRIIKVRPVEFGGENQVATPPTNR
jgi:hypothetical protein